MTIIIQEAPSADEIVEILKAQRHLLHTFTERLNHMAKSLDEIMAVAAAALEQVRKNGDLEASIIAICARNAQTLLDVKAQLEEAKTDKAKLSALGDTIDALASKAVEEGATVADAVTANTDQPAPAPEAPVVE